jgi:hypothetical protein
MGMGGISVWQVLLLTIFFLLVLGALRLRRRWSRRPHGVPPRSQDAIQNVQPHPQVLTSEARARLFLNFFWTLFSAN